MNEGLVTILFATGVVLSVIFKSQKLKVAWDAKSKTFKTYATIGLNAAVGVAILGLACLGVQGIEVPVTCDAVGAGDIIVALGIIYGGSQLAFNVLKKKVS